MAFKILSSDEIELLTEEQRECYENELAIYNERVKFVEQLEKQENVAVTPYEPKFVNISNIKQAPEIIYDKPEYAVELIDVDISSAPKTTAAKFDKPLNARVPKCLKAESVSVEHIKIAEYEKPTMPQIGKTVVPNKIIRKAKQNKPELPQFKGASIQTKARKIQNQNKPLLPVKETAVVPDLTYKKSGQVKASLPEKIKVKAFKERAKPSFVVDKNIRAVSELKKYVPNVSLPESVMPEKINPILPKASVEFAEIKTFEKVKRKDVVLPKAVIPKQVNASFKQVSKPVPELPEVSNITVKKPSYKKTDIRNTELPVTHKTNAPVKTLQKLVYLFADVPTINAAKINSELPKINKPIVKPSVFIKNPVTSSLKIDYPVIDIVPKVSFIKSNRKINGVPSLGGINVPNAYDNDLLKNLLVSSKDEKEMGVHK